MAYQAGAASGTLTAEDAYRQARALWDGLAQAHPDQVDYSANVLRTLVNLSSLYRIVRRPADVEQLYRDAQDLYARCVQAHPVQGRLQVWLARLHIIMAQVHGDAGRRDAQRDALTAAVTLFEQLVRAEPDGYDYKTGLAGALSEVFRLCAHAGQLDQAEAALNRAQQLVEELLRAHPTDVDLQNAQAAFLGNLGNLLYFWRESPERAQPVYEKGRNLLERLHQDYPEVGEFGFNLGNAYSNLEALYRTTGQHEAALEVCVRALALFAPGGQLPEANRGTASTWHALRSENLRRLARYGEALQESQRAIDLSSADRRPALQHGRELIEAFAWAAQGDLGRATGRAEAVAAQAPRDGPLQIVAAAVYVRSAAAVRARPGPRAAADERRAEQYEARALELLQRAYAAGILTEPFLHLTLPRNRDFETLNGRPEFQRLLKDLQARRGS
jgi:tetratricopeptide (TPR) repeat protein